MKVKICGITSYEDASLALDLGADALGFNFFPGSPRCIRAADARDIIRRLPPFAPAVGVFVNVPDPREVDECARAAGVQVLQLHGNESADYVRRLDGWTRIKAVAVGAELDLGYLRSFPAQAFLLDAKDDRLFGGTGRTVDWALARRAAHDFRIILAGGLNPDNVAEAVRTVHPYGVDVCSGVESRPGKKDSARLAAFMKEISHAIR